MDELKDNVIVFIGSVRGVSAWRRGRWRGMGMVARSIQKGGRKLLRPTLCFIIVVMKRKEDIDKQVDALEYYGVTMMPVCFWGVVKG